MQKKAPAYNFAGYINLGAADLSSCLRKEVLAKI